MLENGHIELPLSFPYSRASDIKRINRCQVAINLHVSGVDIAEREKKTES